MRKITLKVDGILCKMCAEHMNDAIKTAFTVKSVSSSYKRGRTVIICENDIPRDELNAVAEKAGFSVVDASYEEYEKKCLFKKLFGK